MIKKIFFVFIFFFWLNQSFAYSWENDIYTGALIPSVSETFVDLDYSNYNYTLSYTWITTGSWIIENYPDYTKEFSDTNKLLFQIELLLFIIWFFVLLFIFYFFITDLLWKK